MAFKLPVSFPPNLHPPSPHPPSPNSPHFHFSLSSQAAINDDNSMTCSWPRKKGGNYPRFPHRFGRRGFHCLKPQWEGERLSPPGADARVSRLTSTAGVDSGQSKTCRLSSKLTPHLRPVFPTALFTIGGGSHSLYPGGLPFQASSIL